MHTYRALWTEGSVGALPDILEYRFNDALDVIAWAEHDRTIGWKTWPEVWHLDDEGAFCCYYKASSLDSIRGWAGDPSGLHRSRREGLATGHCPRRWLIVESRQRWWYDPVIEEGDVKAFLAVREELSTIGLALVDTV